MKPEDNHNPYRSDGIAQALQERIANFERAGMKCVKLPDTIHKGTIIHEIKSAKYLQDYEKIIFWSDRFGILKKANHEIGGYVTAYVWQNENFDLCIEPNGKVWRISRIVEGKAKPL